MGRNSPTTMYYVAHNVNIPKVGKPCSKGLAANFMVREQCTEMSQVEPRYIFQVSFGKIK